METELYFLRSSEQRIVADIVPHALRLESAEHAALAEPFISRDGMSDRDLGLYALQGHTVAGAAWLRRFDGPLVNGFVDKAVPVLCAGIKPDFRGQGIGTLMIGQLLQEASALYKAVSVAVVQTSPAVAFYKRLGFTEVADHPVASPVDDTPVIVMIRELDGIRLQRPEDPVDTSRWMD